MRRTGVEPAARVFRIDPAADLQSAGKGRERRERLRFIARTQHDDVAAGQPVALVKFGKPRGRLLRDKIRAQAAGIAQRAPDDLLHFAFMQINARTEHAPKLKFHE